MRRGQGAGTCDSRTSVKLRSLEEAVLGAMQTELLTADHAELFAAEFRRELARL